MQKKLAARCACGDLIVVLEDKPYFVAICNCKECQRRTGSIFGVSSYFRGPQVTAVHGNHRTFVRSSDSWRPVEFHFCPRCGSTVFWSGVNEPIGEGLGVAAGCFADPDFPKPTLVAWCANRCGWAIFQADTATHDTQPDDLEIFDLSVLLSVGLVLDLALSDLYCSDITYFRFDLWNAHSQPPRPTENFQPCFARFGAGKLTL